MDFRWQGMSLIEPGEAEMRLRAHQSLELNRAIQQSLDCQPEPRDPRASLSLASVDLAMEHHRAVIQLFRRGQRASGAAMLRILLDSGLYATYILLCLTRDEATVMLAGPNFYEEGRHYLPDTQTLMRSLKSLPTVGVNIQTIYEKHLKSFHKLTHGDVPQLVRRRHGGPAFSAGEARNFLALSDIFMLASAYVGAQALQSAFLKEEIISRRSEVLAEILISSGASFEARYFEEVAPDPAWQTNEEPS